MRIALPARRVGLRHRAGRVLGALALLLLAGATLAERAPEGVRAGKPRRLRVTHTTRVRVEPGTVRLRVVQAKPVERTFAGLRAPLGVQEVSFAPAGAQQEVLDAEGGAGWAWDVRDPAPGEATFVSTFEVLSAERDLRASGLEVRWADLPSDPSALLQGRPALPPADEALQDVVAKVKRKERNVLDALGAFARHVKTLVAYVPGVTYAPDDLAAICRGRAGHCGHRATVFLALCRAAGIPARRVVGYALLNHPLAPGSVDDTNRHVWVQVHLPRLGWVEVEPAPDGSVFAVPHLFLLNPLDLQSRAVVAFAADGRRSSPLVADTLRVEEVR